MFVQVRLYYFKKLLLLICGSIFLILIWNLIYPEKFEIPAEILRFNEIIANISDDLICHVKIPDPWDLSITSYIKSPHLPIKCDPRQKNLTALVNNHLILVNEAAEDSYSYSCRYRYFYHNSGVDDFSLKYSDWSELPKEGVMMETDFVEVECSNSLGLNEYHYQWAQVVHRNVSIETERPFFNESEESLSVIMLGFDGISRSEFHRQMPKSLAQMSKMGFVEMNKHVKIADNTFPNWMAIMLGKHTYDSDFGKGEVDSSYYLSYDNWTDLIWRKFGREGYATFFAEDASYQTYEIATFNYDKKSYGFIEKPPVDHYMRPYFLSFAGSLLSIRSTYFCYDAIPEHVLQLNYLEDFIKKYQGIRKFAWNWFIRIAHDYLNTVGLADADVANFLLRTQPYLNRSIIVVFADHGNRYDNIRETLVGRLESGLPILSIYVPPWFRRKHPSMFANLKENSKIMTTHFDLHGTLMDILKGNFSTSQRYKMVQNRGYSLFDWIPTNRDCAKAQVPLQYCPCFPEVEGNREEGVIPAEFVVKYVKKLIREKSFKDKCAPMDLSSIKSAFVSIPSKQIYEKVNSAFLINYRVVFQVIPPSNAILEAVVEKNLDTQQMRIIGDIQRNNRYGNTSSCTTDRVLKKLCHCL